MKYITNKEGHNKKKKIHNKANKTNKKNQIRTIKRRRPRTPLIDILPE